jgi:hypothetical protein
MGRYEIDFLDEYTDEALLAELRRIAALLPSGKRLTQATYEKLSGRASRVTFLRRFGGWKQALGKAGLDHLHGRWLTVARLHLRTFRHFAKTAISEKAGTSNQIAWSKADNGILV